jgi:hypothetical protein
VNAAARAGGSVPTMARRDHDAIAAQRRDLTQRFRADGHVHRAPALGQLGAEAREHGHEAAYQVVDDAARDGAVVGRDDLVAVALDGFGLEGVGGVG